MLTFTTEVISKIKSMNLLELSCYITDKDAKGYFLEEPGVEHYKLLAYLSTLFSGVIISDIGTFRGASALALSYNKQNKVVSYDIKNKRRLNGKPENVEFVVYREGFSKDIFYSALIFLDTLHDGVLEREIVSFLKQHKWRGILILDDIHKFPPLNELWNEIDAPKEDITSIGHHSGTGIVYFK